MKTKLLALVFAIVAVCGFAQSVTTARHDGSRDSFTSSETVLTPSSVAVHKFGLKCKMNVDGDLYSQPLYAPHVNVSGTPRDLVIVATMHNSVYAFNAANCAQVWTTNFGTAWQFPNYPHIDGSPLEYTHEIGISNAVVDTVNGWVYAVTVNNSGVWTLRKLALSTGSTSLSAVISGQVIGTGDPVTGNNPGSPPNTDTTSGSNLLFNGAVELQRTALLLSSTGSIVYIGFGSHSDIHPYHGWMFAYNTSDLSQKAVLCITPNASGGGVWNGGGGPSLLPNGDVIFSTGNGDYDGITSFAQSIVHVSGTTLAILDWYTPSSWAAMNTLDSDLGSGPTMLIPGSTKLVTGAKDYRIFSADYTCLGQLGGSVGGCGPAQVFYTNAAGTVTDHSGVYNGAFFNGAAYFPNTGGQIYKFSFASNSFNTTPITSVASYEFPGAQMSVSANGTSNAIVWATTASTSTLYSLEAGTLRALNPADLSEYWDSDMEAQDAMGSLSKYATPTVASGRVFVSTQSGYIAVYGLLPSKTTNGSTNKR